MRLLAFDGGGIRGLSSLYILQDLMAKIQSIHDLEAEPLPSDYFDMICGTSTGGIIALMLGRLSMSVTECIDAYLEMSSRVFGHPNGPTHREKFNPTALQNAIQDVVERKVGDRHARLMDTSCCKTFVCTFDKNALGGTPTLLRTYRTGSAVVECTIWEAARATSAAPTFFPPIEFRSQPGIYYVDAGIGCNNPTQTLLKEAGSYCRLKRIPFTFPACLLSIGTGQKDLIQLQQAASMFWFKDRVGLSIASALGDIVTDCEKTHDAVVRVCIDEGTTDRYFRLNVLQGMQKIVLDEWDKAAEIKTSTNAYLKLNQIEEELLRCVELLGDQQDQQIGRQARSPENSSYVEGPQRLQITQGDNEFEDSTVVGGRSAQGNFANVRFGDFKRRS